MCVVNGRVSSEFQNFTSISKKGCSVIDYMCVRHSDLSNCICFTVHPVLNLVSQLNLHSDKIPDHSVLELLYMPHVMIQTSTTESCANNNRCKESK